MRHWPHRERLFHYCVFSSFRGNNVSTELFRSNSCCTVAYLHTCYLAMGMQVTINVTAFFASLWGVWSVVVRHLFSSKRRTHFKTCKSWEDQKCCHGSRLDPKQRLAVLARPSSNLPDQLIEFLSIMRHFLTYSKRDCLILEIYITVYILFVAYLYSYPEFQQHHCPHVPPNCWDICIRKWY
jgi:hypothetical protein